MSNSSVPLPRTNITEGGANTGMNGDSWSPTDSNTSQRSPATQAAWPLLGWRLVARTEHGLLEPLRVGLVIIVPMPSSVKISSSSTWAMRPSRMWARPTPLRTAWVHASTLGIIPPAIVPSAISASSSSAVVWRIRLAGVGDVAPQPLDVRQVDELGRTERLGDGRRDTVGVDVVGLPSGVGADGGHDRDELVGEQTFEDVGVDRARRRRRTRAPRHAGWPAAARRPRR